MTTPAETTFLREIDKKLWTCGRPRHGLNIGMRKLHTTAHE
jgi:hypothetical protein